VLTIIPGRRTAPEKWTPLRSKIADIAHGHQIAPSFTSASNQYPLSVGEASPLLVLKPVVMELSAGYFPLSSDHLIHLIQFNVFRAMLTNMFTLRITNLFECEEKVSEQMRISQLPLPAGVPPSLEPTALQRQVPHAPYVDLFPLASLRDTLVRAEGMYDDCELCVDLLGAISGPQVGGYSSSNEGNDDHRKGLVVWGEPWQVDSWEVEEGFVKKWGWMLKDNCEDLIRSTNRWRQVRGDEPLRWTDWGINVEAFDACSSARPPRLPFGHGLKQLLCKHGDKEE
jgi:hypothetical protein